MLLFGPGTNAGYLARSRNLSSRLRGHPGQAAACHSRHLRPLGRTGADRQCGRVSATALRLRRLPGLHLPADLARPRQPRARRPGAPAALGGGHPQWQRAGAWLGSRCIRAAQGDVPGGPDSARAALAAKRPRSRGAPGDRTGAEAAARGGRADPRQRSKLSQHARLFRQWHDRSAGRGVRRLAARNDGRRRRARRCPHSMGTRTGCPRCAPHEDHLLPLMVAAGAASGEPGTVHYHGHAFGKPISGFRFG